MCKVTKVSYAASVGCMSSSHAALTGRNTDQTFSLGSRKTSFGGQANMACQLNIILVDTTQKPLEIWKDRPAMKPSMYFRAKAVNAALEPLEHGTTYSLMSPTNPSSCRGSSATMSPYLGRSMISQKYPDTLVYYIIEKLSLDH
jgi:hypothetical protein